MRVAEIMLTLAKKSDSCSASCLAGISFPRLSSETSQPRRMISASPFSRTALSSSSNGWLKHQWSSSPMTQWYSVFSSSTERRMLALPPMLYGLRWVERVGQDCIRFCTVFGVSSVDALSRTSSGVSGSAA